MPTSSAKYLPKDQTPGRVLRSKVTRLVRTVFSPTMSTTMASAGDIRVHVVDWPSVFTTSGSRSLSPPGHSMACLAGGGGGGAALEDERADMPQRPHTSALAWPEMAMADGVSRCHLRLAHTSPQVT